MSKRNILLCSLVLLLTVFSSVAFATAPYASIVAYNEGVSNQGGGAYRAQPNFSALGVLDIINMTPWDISVGPGQDQEMLPGMSTLQAWSGFWLAGFHKPNNQGNFGGSFAFHSIQIALNNLNNAWALKTPIPNVYSQPISYDSIPIVFNSNSFTQNGNTAALNFIVTSSAGFDVSYNSGINNFPATAISFGDGTNNYGWETNDTMIYSGGNWKNVTHFLTLQGLGTTANTWKPIVKNLGGSVARNNGMGGSAPGTTVQMPTFLNLSGLAYKNFSQTATGKPGLDLVVIIQSGGYADMQLLFIAVPTANNGFLNGL